VHNERNEKEAVMNVGPSRRVPPLVALFLVAGAAGCTCTRPTRTNLSPCPVQNKEHVVLLRSELQSGHWKAIAHPDFLTVRGYDPPNTVVIWAYHDASIRIRFDDSAIPEPVCKDGVCTLELPKDLKLSPYKYKYTVTGTRADKTELDPNDPWIEVDR
jgi:hypothetical protein